MPDRRLASQQSRRPKPGPKKKGSNQHTKKDRGKKSPDAPPTLEFRSGPDLVALLIADERPLASAAGLIAHARTDTTADGRDRRNTAIYIGLHYWRLQRPPHQTPWPARRKDRGTRARYAGAPRGCSGALRRNRAVRVLNVPEQAWA
jgi:hypothetical protein